MTDMMVLLEDFYDDLHHRVEMELRRDASRTMMDVIMCFVVLPLVMVSMMVIL